MQSLHPRGDTVEIEELADQLNLEPWIVRRVLTAAQNKRSLKGHQYGVNYTKGAAILD